MNQVQHMDDDRFLGQVREHIDTLGKQADTDALRLEHAQALLSGFFGLMPEVDRSQHAPDEWAALLVEMSGFLLERPSGRARVRIFNPSREQAGWGGLRTTIQVVTDDMPFLVDTLNMAVARSGHRVHMVAHPVITARRDRNGVLQQINVDGDAAEHESIMHLEIDRLAGDEECQLLQADLESSLSDVRLAVQDWQPMRGKMLQIAEEL
ncbi:MAG: NAD-glutamate dehydrogenase, partial [Oleiagrimonas sp.]